MSIQDSFFYIKIDNRSYGGNMKLKEMVSMDVLKEFDFRLAEHGSLTHEKTMNNHYIL